MVYAHIRKSESSGYVAFMTKILALGGWLE
jgi:hypothetical protein